MRRSDKEIPFRTEIETLLRRGTVCHLALHDTPWPYVVPLNYGFEAESGERWTLYFHSAPAGRKIDLIRRNARASFTVSLDDELVAGNTACEFTTRYASVMGCGSIRVLETDEDKRHGLRVLMRHCSGRYDWEVPVERLAAVTVFSLPIEMVSAKRSG